MTFPLAGNVKIKPSVENILKEKRIPHAIVIDGDKGTGKHTLTHFLSCAIVCSGEDIPCGKCVNCRTALTHNHPDIAVISPEEGKKTIAISQIRELKNAAYVKPHQANSKVFIIDPADSLSPRCQNALLKILEEPPKSTLFVLVAESKASLLDTVLSRCVSLSLNVPTFNEAVEYLLKLTEFERPQIEEALNVSRNNIGNALSLLKGSSEDKAEATAAEFLNHAFKGDSFGMLTCLLPFEGSRVDADRILKSIKLSVAGELRKNPASVRAAAMLKFYNKLTYFEEALATNVTLSLLFADLTATAKEYISY